jgi:hypothetical protein
MPGVTHPRIRRPLGAALALGMICISACGSAVAAVGVAAHTIASPDGVWRAPGAAFPPDFVAQPSALPAIAAPPAATSAVLFTQPSARPSTPPPVTTAPRSGPTIGGCPVFPASNPWNQDISHAAIDPHSAAYVARIDSSRQFLHPDFGSNPSYGIPVVVVPGSQPRVPITFTAYGAESDPGPYPMPLNAPVEQGSDRHALAVDTGDCHLYELYQAQRLGSGWSAASGAVFDLRSNALRPDTWTSADAAGLPILPGLARYDEVASGVINHALRFTVAETQNGFIHPATHQAGVANASDPPMGARFRLKASFDLSSYHGESLVILTALKRYGMMVADNGSSWFVSGATDPRWKDSDLNQLKSVPGNAFEAVSTGPILRG